MEDLATSTAVTDHDPFHRNPDDANKLVSQPGDDGDGDLANIGGELTIRIPMRLGHHKLKEKNSTIVAC